MKLDIDHREARRQHFNACPLVALITNCGHLDIACSLFEVFDDVNTIEIRGTTRYQFTILLDNNVDERKLFTRFLVGDGTLETSRSKRIHLGVGDHTVFSSGS